MRFDDGIPDLTPEELAARVAARAREVSRKFAPKLAAGAHAYRTPAKYGRKPRKVIDLQTGKVFTDYQAAAAMFGVHSCSIGTAISRPTRVCGHWLAWLTPELETEQGRKAELAKRPQLSSQGMRYQSVA